MSVETLGKSRTEQLRFWAGNKVKDLLGYSEDTVVTAAIACLGRRLTEGQTKEQLNPLLEEETGKFVEELYLRHQQLLEDKKYDTKEIATIQQQPKIKKRGIEDVFGDDVEDSMDYSSRKVSKMRLPHEQEEETRLIQTDLTPAEQRAFDEMAMKQINKLREKVQKDEDRKRSKDSINKDGAKAYLTEAMASKDRASVLQAKISQRMATLNLPGIAKAPVLDKEGRTLDSSGKAISVIKHEPTLKVNLRESKRKNFKMEKPDDNLTVTNPYFDPRMRIKGATRQPKAMKFNESGKYIQLAQKQRAHSKLEELQKQIAATAKKTGISTVAKRVMLSDNNLSKEDPVPEVEWWDKFILVSENYENCETPVSQEELTRSVASPKYREITHLIEHPLSKPPPGAAETAPPLSVVLTKKERRKLRTQRRLERQREEQEKIRLGLMPPPPPKVRIANLMRVLCSEAVQDPTKVEATVRAQAAERQKKHQKANSERQLTKEQRGAKKMAKLSEDTSQGVHIAVFRIDNLSNPQHKYKVETNATQFMFTGLMLLSKDNNIVIIEGGPKGLRKFKRLMMIRMKWDEDVRNRKNQDDDKRPKNKCKLIWEGTRKTRFFSKFATKLITGDPSAAKEYLAKYNCQNFWDLAVCESIVSEEV
ncbi:U4/U6 small nuclear ribonucleoprotein Prp3-like [Bolinopsis microptera]|uniref:U4/U6 small nuclear ribonucleoprotein Prp3-like n=1 Tax=Bolinopsis microptera TaxID=2820187 RepID=UPI003078F81C